MPIDAYAILQLKSDVRQSRVADEGIILRQDDGEILVVNEVAIHFIELLDGQKSIDALADILFQEYAVERTVLLADLVEYTQELIEQGVLDVRR